MPLKKLSLYPPWRRVGEVDEQLYSFLTSAPDVGEPPVTIEQEAGWASERIWVLLEKRVSPAEREKRNSKLPVCFGAM